MSRPLFQPRLPLHLCFELRSQDCLSFLLITIHPLSFPDTRAPPPPYPLLGSRSKGRWRERELVCRFTRSSVNLRSLRLTFLLPSLLLPHHPASLTYTATAAAFDDTHLGCRISDESFSKREGFFSSFSRASLAVSLIEMRTSYTRMREREARICCDLVYKY